MISLEDRIQIQTTPGQVFAWLERFPQEYCAWHPDHVGCRLIRGPLLEVGSEIECQEYLHGDLHTMKLRTTKVVPGKRIEYDAVGLGGGAFEVQPAGDAVTFVAELYVGSDAFIIGRLLDWVFLRLFQGRIDALKQHMVEEGINLKEILEKTPSNAPEAA